MKHLANLLLLLAVVLISIGCSSLLTRTAAPDSTPVQMGVATTNTPATVAWIEVAKTLNAAAPPNPYQPLVAAALSGLGALAAAAAGFFGHRHATAATSVAESTAKSEKNN